MATIKIIEENLLSKDQKAKVKGGNVCPFHSASGDCIGYSDIGSPCISKGSSSCHPVAMECIPLNCLTLELQPSCTNKGWWNRFF